MNNATSHASPAAVGDWPYPANCIAVINGIRVFEEDGDTFCLWTESAGLFGFHLRREAAVRVARTIEMRVGGEAWRPGEVPLA